MNAQLYVNAWKASDRSLEWRRSLWQFLKDRAEHITLETDWAGDTWQRINERYQDGFTGV